MNSVCRLFITLIIACVSVAQAQTKPVPGKGQAPATQAEKSVAPAASQPAKKADDCGCEASAPVDALAIVNGVKLTLKDIDEPIKDRIKSLQNEVIEARKRELDLQINSKLLEAEAKKSGISATALIEQEVIAKVKNPTEAEAQAFYEQNKGRIQDTFDNVKSDVIAYLRDQRQTEQARLFAERLRASAQVKILVEEVSAPASAADRARPLATVNAERITSGDIEDSLRPLIFSVQEQVYNLRKGQLEIKINDLLLEQEAQKRKVTTRALLETEVTPKVKTITEADAQTFYEQNKSKINGEFAQVKGQIVEYLQGLEQTNAEKAFALQLRSGATVQVELTPPDPPVYQIATDDQPMKGTANAPVTIVEFTDFQCPSCAKTQPLLEEIVKEYADKVRLVVRDYPLQQHANAMKAAEAAEAAREQGKYWEYITLLFQNQDALGEEKLKEYATRLGLDRKKFDEALESGKYSDKIKRDIQDGYKVGVNSTPTVFINGKRVREKTRESLKAAIDASLKKQAKK